MWLCLNRCKQRDDIVVLGALGFSGLQNWISTSPFHALSSTITSSFYLAPHVSPSYRIPPSVRLLPVTPYRRRMRRRAAASAALKEHKRLLSAIFLTFLMFNASLGAFEHGVLGDLVPHLLIRRRYVVSSGINQKNETSPEEGWNINLIDWFTGERLEERPECLLAPHQRSACKSGTKRWGNWARLQLWFRDETGTAPRRRQKAESGREAAAAKLGRGR